MITDVLITGAGPVGLVMAAELSRYNLNIRIIDKKERPSRYSKALGIMPRTLELLEKQRVTGKMLEAGNALQGMNMYRGKRRTRFPTNEYLDSPYPILVLPQSHTEYILIERLQEYGVEVEWNTELTEIHQTDTTVRATLRLPDGEEEASDFSWMIACDGTRSTSRKLLGMDFETDEVRETFLLADLDLFWDLPQNETHTFLSADGDMAVFPFADQPYSRIVIPDFTPPEGDEITLDTIETLFRERCHFDAELKEPDWISTFRIKKGIIDSYRDHRVFFAGDAAHIHSPQGGQGMNSGIQDAFNLAWKLAMVHKGISNPALLETYQEERKAIAEKIIRTTSSTTEITLFENPRLRKVRNFIITSAAPVYGKFMIQSIGNLNLSYRKNEFVKNAIPLKTRFNPFDSELAAGERVPDVMWIDSSGNQQRLFELLNSVDLVLLYFTFDQPAEDLWKQFRHYPDLEIYQISRSRVKESAHKGKILTDPRGILYRTFRLNGPAVYVVRPDGYTAFRSQPADLKKTARYLETLFSVSTD